MDVDDAADELYGLPLEEFVAARNAMAKQARNEEPAQAAGRIKALRKPTVAAWLVNRLVREHRSRVQELLDLGEQMRKATASLDGKRLRELTSRRRELVDALLGNVKELTGQRVSDDVMQEVSETLLAAMADPGAADELRAGRLIRGLRHVGFGPIGEPGEPAEVISLTEARAARGQRAEPADRGDREGRENRQDREDDEAEQRRAEYEREVEQAESAVTAAEDRVDDLENDVDERRRDVDSAESAVERLTAELAEARQELDRAQARLEGGQNDLDEAKDAAEEARRQRREAKRNLSRLEG